ncbi:hypothetical protein KP509_14G033100 [Ceratopteris richardii]|uniref:Uncharacterized protein n=2 Tax=Ceratopteris richardii TaxID=49495 RepID=A0A8T2T8E0_CERRI|nr:hypothetical protein KP509_14G033100 [Ceratopteris richardii]
MIFCSFNEINDCDQLESGCTRRRWSLPTQLMHNAHTHDATEIKYARKTVGKVQAQNKREHVAIDTIIPLARTSSQAEQESLLQPSNRMNLPINMFRSAGASYSKARKQSKENRRCSEESNLESTDNGKVELTATLKSSMQQPSKRRTHDCSKSRMHVVEHDSLSTRSYPSSPEKSKSDTQACFIRNPNEDQMQDSKDDKSNDGTSLCSHLPPIRTTVPKDLKPNTIQLRALMDADVGNTDTFTRNGKIKKKFSVSMKTLMRQEDENSRCVEHIESFPSVMPTRSFSVTLEEIKPSKRKPWNFNHGVKASNNMVMMFPNPTFDEIAMSPTTISPYIPSQRGDKVTGCTSPPPTEGKMVHSSNRKDIIQKREKIVRLTPCTVIKRHVLSAATASVANTSKGAPSARNQKWLCADTHSTETPRVNRRLSEAHQINEMSKGVRARFMDTKDSVILESHAIQSPLGKTWSFGSSLCTDSEARRLSSKSSGINTLFIRIDYAHFHSVFRKMGVIGIIVVENCV